MYSDIGKYARIDYLVSKNIIQNKLPYKKYNIKEY